MPIPAAQLHLLDLQQHAGGALLAGLTSARELAGGALSLLSSVAPAGWLQRGAAKASAALDTLQPAEPKAAAHAGETECVRAFYDPPRAVQRLVMDPFRYARAHTHTQHHRHAASFRVWDGRRWLAASDSLGRVLLLESRTLVALRVWKARSRWP